MKKLSILLLFCSLTALGQTQIDRSQIKDGIINNAKVDASANISYSKINFTGITASAVGAESPLTFSSPLSRTSNTISLLTVPVSLGGTGLTSLAVGRILFGNDSSTAASSANLFWDATNNRLGINQGVPTVDLDVTGTINASVKVTTATLQVSQGATDTYIAQSDATGNLSWVDPVGLVTTLSGWSYTSPLITPTTSTDEVSIPGVTQIGDYTASLATSLFTVEKTYSSATDDAFTFENTDVTFDWATGTGTENLWGKSVNVNVGSTWDSTGSNNNIVSIRSHVNLGHAAGTITNAYSNIATLYVTGDGTTTNVRGVQSRVGLQSGTGGITASAAFYARSPLTTGSGTISANYGLYIEDQSNASAANVTTPYQIYSEGAAITHFKETSGSFPALILQTGSAGPSAAVLEIRNSADAVVASIDHTGLGTFNTLDVGTAKFTINSTGNITKLNDVTTSFPSSQGAANSVLHNDGSGNLSWVTSVPTWIKVTKTFTDFSTAGLTNSIEVLSLPAGGVIHAVKIKHSTAFSGGSISAYTVSVGIVGNTTKYAGAFDVFQATGNTVQQLSSTVGTENHGAATSIKIEATSVGANLDQAAAGSVDVWILVSNAS